MQKNNQGTEKNSQKYFCPRKARFSDMPVYLKSGITAKPLYLCSEVCFPILLNMQSHSREATGTVTPFDKYAESQSRSDCCAVTVAKRLLPNFERHSREATVMPRRRGEAASFA